MTTAQELAAHYGLATADTLPPLPSGEEAWGTVLPPLKLTPGQLKLFKKFKPHALCIVGTDGPVSTNLLTPEGRIKKRIGGHNSGYWQMRTATTGSHKDTVTANYDKAPDRRTGVQIRLWLRTEEHAKRLERKVLALIEHYAEEAMGTPLLNGFVDVGPQFRFEILEGEILSRAAQEGYGVRNDRELVAWLEKIRREEDLLEGVGG
ncbi:hypothetical protein [Filomicrobium sp.]|uniref:hypothetical protein n=1 Tax=Filomicrobium sp. TaxID=2024831 RepID=UPI00258BE18F|nr:hypothetical protein [Filomicrobium sp.]MCV0371100.1 hypothetical protein [Filomicrobium sp.]